MLFSSRLETVSVSTWKRPEVSGRLGLERKVCAAEHGVDHLDVRVALEKVAENLAADCRGLVDAAAVGTAQIIIREQRLILDRHGHMVHVGGDAALV